MKFFIDSANLKEIEEISSLGILDGVTTNPSLMAKEGVTGKANILQRYKDICKLVPGNVSAEVLATDFKDMLQEAEELAALDKKIVVKIPMTKDGIKAIRHLAERGIRTNCTLTFSVGQAILAAKAGATFVSPFIGRLDDINQDGVALIQQIVHVYSIYQFETKVLAASIRHPLHVVKCAELGADIVTCPYHVLMALFHHPLTDIGLAKFLADHAKAAKKDKK